MKALRITAALAIIACLGIVRAQAQDATPKVGERIGDWVFQCQALSATNTVCGLIQNIADRGTQRQVLGVAVRPIGDDGRLAMIVTAPLGIFLGSGIGGKVDEGAQFAFNLQSCSQRGCQAALELKDDLLSALKKGNRLIVGYKARPDSQTIAIPVSLTGFTAGLDAILKK
jgi:invasion protein IalB